MSYSYLYLYSDVQYLADFKNVDALPHLAPERLTLKAPCFKPGPADCWSLGVTALEILTGTKLLGVPDAKACVSAKLEGLNEEQARMISAVHAPDFAITSMSRDVGPEAEAAAVDFVRQLLQTDPQMRKTAQDALHHPYLQRELELDYSNPEAQKVRMSPLEILLRVSTAPLSAHVSLMSEWASPGSPASPHPAKPKGSSEGPLPITPPGSAGSPTSTLEQPASPVSPKPAMEIGGSPTKSRQGSPGAPTLPAASEGSTLTRAATPPNGRSSGSPITSAPVGATSAPSSQLSAALPPASAASSQTSTETSQTSARTSQDLGGTSGKSKKTGKKAKKKGKGK